MKSGGFIIFKLSIKNISAWLRNIAGGTDPAALGILIFAFYIFTQRWFAIYFGSGFLQVAVVFFALALLFLHSDLRRYKLIALSWIDILWLIGVGVVIINIFLIDCVRYKLDLFTYTSGFIFLFLAKAKMDKYKYTILFLKGASIIYALSTITQFLFTDSFNRFMFNYSIPVVQDRIDSLTRSHYYPGLAFAMPSIAAGYMTIGVGIIMTFWVKLNYKQRILDAFLFVVIFAAILLTGKRSIFLWSLIAVCITYLYLAIGRERVKRIVRIFIISVGATVALILLQLPDGFPLYFRLSNLIADVGTLLKGDDLTSGSFYVRTVLYYEAWQVFLENPIFGAGWRQNIFDATGIPLFNHPYHSPHNVYLQLLSEIGIIGFTAVMAPFIYTYGVTYKFLQDLLIRIDRLDSQWMSAIAFSLYYQTFFMLYMLTENAFYHVAYVLAYFFVISITNSLMVIDKKPAICIDLRFMMKR